VKTDDFKPFDDVADSMTAAAARLGIPLELLKQMKRNGCAAFRGSRVHLGKLREAIATAEKEPSTSDVLLMIVKEVARTVASRLLHGGARLRVDSHKLTQVIHNGFGAALLVVEPDNVDRFLKRSATLFEQVFKSARKGRESINPKRIAAKNHRNN
jgi:hypothetical protein